MRMKLPLTIRPEFRRFLKDCKTLKAAAEVSGATWQAIAMMKSRGFMSIAVANDTEKKSGGEYQARLLCERGEI